MDVNIRSTFKKGGRSASVSTEISQLLPSQRLREKRESAFSLVSRIETKPSEQKESRVSLVSTIETKPSQQEDTQVKVREMFDILHTFSEFNSLSKEDVHEILDVFETEVFTEENYPDMLNRAKLLAKHGIIPEIIEDEPTSGGAKRIIKARKIFEPDVGTKRRSTQKIRRYVPTPKDLLSARADRPIRLSRGSRLPRLPDVPRESVTIIPDRTPEEKDRILSLIHDTIFDTKSMSKVVNIIFEQAPINIYSQEQGEKYRDIYELSAVDAQCNNTIGKSNSLDDAGNRKFPGCYICGFKFYEDNDSGIFTGVDKNTKDELRATCEHILPIIQAAFFLELYRPGIDMTNPVIKQQLELEYSWAHRCCNYEKSDISFIKTQINKQSKVLSFGPNKNRIQSVLTGIENSKNTRVGLNIIQSQIPSKPAWTDAQNKSITSMVNDITDYLNSRGNIGLLFAIGYDKITSSERISQKFINAIAEARQRIREGPVKTFFKSIPGSERILTGRYFVQSPYQQSLKRTLGEQK